MEYTEYVIKLRVAVLTGSGTLLLGTGRTLTAISRQRVAYFLKRHCY